MFSMFLLPNKFHLQPIHKVKTTILLLAKINESGEFIEFEFGEVKFVISVPSVFCEVCNAVENALSRKVSPLFIDAIIFLDFLYISNAEVHK